MMKESLDQLMRQLQELTNNPLIEVLHNNLSPPYSQTDLDDLEHDLGIRYTKDLRYFYSVMGGISLSWQLSDKGMEKLNDVPDVYTISGAINLLNPYELVAGKDGQQWENILWFKDKPFHEVTNNSLFRPFDFSNTEWVAGFLFVEKQLLDPLRLLESNEGLLETTYSLTDYIKQLAQTRGYYYWQMVIADKTTAEYRDFTRYMPQLFPTFSIESL